MALAAEIRRRLGPPPDLPRWPLVSIVVLNRDGCSRLRRLIAGLIECTDYPSLELIVVDNASSDDSLDYVRTVEAPFPISILANVHNESFSDACNQGAELAVGELLLFLNNDAEPFEPGWLRELVACLGGEGVAAAGPTLIEPAVDSVPPHGYLVHQRGLWAREDDEGRLVPDYRDHGADPLREGLGRDAEVMAVAAACLLIDRRDFDRVGGFTHGYWYGPEDVDLALKLRDAGGRTICSGRSVLIHPPNSTLSEVPAERRREWLRGNRRLFMERWGARLRREYERDRREGRGFWAAPPSRWSDAAAWEGDGLRREVFFFASGGVQLYGSLYAAAEPSRPFGLLACSSWGIEADRCDPLLRAVALTAARQGGVAMVFHYPGYGDSFGDLAELDLADLAQAARDAVAEASRRRPGFSWTLAGFAFGAAVAALAQRGALVESLLLVQPALRPSVYFEQIAKGPRRVKVGSGGGEEIPVGAEDGMAFGYPVPARIIEAGEEGDRSALTALTSFAGEGTVIRQATTAEAEPVPERFELVEAPGSWRFGAQHHPELAKAVVEWLDRRGAEAGR